MRILASIFLVAVLVATLTVAPVSDTLVESSSPVASEVEAHGGHHCLHSNHSWYGKWPKNYVLYRENYKYHFNSGGKHYHRLVMEKRDYRKPTLYWERMYPITRRC